MAGKQSSKGAAPSKATGGKQSSKGAAPSKASGGSGASKSGGGASKSGAPAKGGSSGGGGYKMSFNDMLSYGFKYGESWSEDKRAFEKAFNDADRQNANK